MSGGSLDYFYCMLQEHAGDFGDKELDELVSDLAELFHDREWFLSGDTGDGDWNEARDKFKARWFTKYGRQKRIDKYLLEMSNEVRIMIGMFDKYCFKCKHWTPEKDGKYGKCEYQKCCLNHRKETCDKFERKDADDDT